MKMPIAWHERNLANQRESLKSAVFRQEYAQEEQFRLLASVDLYERQMAEAKRRGMDAFDRDRLLVKRGGGETPLVGADPPWLEEAVIVGQDKALETCSPSAGIRAAAAFAARQPRPITDALVEVAPSEWDCGQSKEFCAWAHLLGPERIHEQEERLARIFAIVRDQVRRQPRPITNAMVTAAFHYLADRGIGLTTTEVRAAFEAAEEARNNG